MGVRYGVVTNKSERLARLLLGELGLAARMGAIIGGDTLPTRKPDPAPLLAMRAACSGRAQPFMAGEAHPLAESKMQPFTAGEAHPLTERKVQPFTAREAQRRMAFVGDSHFDIDAARAANMRSVACSFGYLMQPVETLGADAVIDSFDALIPALGALTP